VKRWRWGAGLAGEGVGRKACTTTRGGHGGAGQFYFAMLLTVGPVVVMPGGYGLMLLVFVTFGRNIRWN
jgi:hypothetical protein